MSHRDVGKKVIITMIKARLDATDADTLADVAEIMLDQEIEYRTETDIYRIFDREPPF